MMEPHFLGSMIRKPFIPQMGIRGQETINMRLRQR